MVDAEECPICMNGRCKSIEKDIASNVYTKRAVATELKIPIEVVWKHMNEHFGRDTVTNCYKDHGSMDEGTIEELYGKKKVLLDMVMKLKDRIDGLINVDELKPVDTSNIMKTAQTLLKAVELLGRLEGDFQEDRKVTVELYVSLKSAVLMATQDHPEIMQEIIAGVKVAEQKAARVLKIEVPKELTTAVGSED